MSYQSSTTKPGEQKGFTGVSSSQGYSFSSAEGRSQMGTFHQQTIGGLASTTPVGTSSVRGTESVAGSRLQYEGQDHSNDIIISGVSDIGNLRNIKNVLLSLQTEFLQGDARVIISGPQKEQFNKRLRLLQDQIQGLMRRRITTQADSQGRTLDYTGILNQKENQVVELEKKIQNLEEKLRRCSKREGELEDEVVRLTSIIKTINSSTLSKQDLERLTIGALQVASTEEKMGRLRNQMSVFGGLMRSQFDKLRSSGVKLQLQASLQQLLRSDNIQVSAVSGVANIVQYREKLVQVPVQDSRTKHLIHMLAVQMKKYFDKYPKLRDECDARLYELFQQELIDVMEVDQFERVVEIVKHQTKVVKVDNVYAYSNEKSRKVQFHLRVLIKALLEELEKVKRRTGVALEIDEGVIGMINQEIMGVVNVDDILKVFRVVPKIVEVEKIVEKIVDRIVQVPTVVTVERIVEKIVEMEKIREVEVKVPVEIEVPKIVTNTVEKVVQVERVIEKAKEVPTIVQRIVEVIKEVPKIVQVQRIVEKIVQVEKVIPVKEVVNHISVEVREVQVIKEKIVNTERVVEKIVEVPYIVEKIVEKIVQVPQIIEVERIVEKIVPQIEYRNAKEIQNHIEIRNVIVDRIVEKPIPILQIEERIVEVPQIVEKIVQVTNTIREPFEVQVIVEKIVIQERIKQVERIVERVVEVIKEVPIEVEKIVQIPLIQERIVTVQVIVEKPVIQVHERTVPLIVEIRDPLIVREPRTVEVEKIVNHYIEVPKPVKYIEEKIVEVIRHVDRIKEIKVPVEKIIEKMVEVPKVVEVEKIVEKIVVVPRVVEKIVQVPQIVERIVPKLVIEERIKEVQRIVQVPVIQEKFIQIPVEKIVYLEVEKVVDRVVDRPYEIKTTEEKIVNNQVIVEKVIEVVREVPRTLQVQRIVYNNIQVPQIVEVERQIIVPIQIPVPVQKIVQKLVPMTETIQKIVQVPHVIEKIVAQKTEDVRVQEIVRVEERIVVDTKVKEVVKEVPYIRDQIKEVQVMVEKIVPIQSIVQEVVTAKQIIEKIVEKSTIVPKIYEVQRREEKVVEVPRIVEVDRIIPQLVNVNRYIQSIVEKIVQVPIIMESIKQITLEIQKPVEVRTDHVEIREVDRLVQQTVAYDRLKEVVREISHIEKVLQIVDRTVHQPVEIIAHEERLVEVPYILEKIVQKIVIMPQIVQVLKYVHEVVEEESLGVAVGVDFATHEQRYKNLSKDLKGSLDLLLLEIRKLRQSNPALRVQIELIEKFLADLEQFILTPRIVQVEKQVMVDKIVEKDRLVHLPKADDRSVKMELTLSLLVEKLIVELKRLKKDYPNINFNLEDDVRLIFFTELDGSRLAGEEMNSKLKSFADMIYRKFEAAGNWSADQQLMLNSFLQERFLMANLVRNANLEIERSKTFTVEREESMKRYQADLNALQTFLSKIRATMSNDDHSIEQNSLIINIFREYDAYASTKTLLEPMITLGDVQVNDQRIQSLLREKDAEIFKLREKIYAIQRMKLGDSNAEAHQRALSVLQSENLKLLNEINQLRSETGSADLMNYQQQIKTLKQRILELQQDKSNLTMQLHNLKREWQVKEQVFKSNIDIKSSSTTNINNSNMASPARQYMHSPNESAASGARDIRMVDSRVEGYGATYGTLSDSRQSGSSASREQTSPVNPTQQPTQYTSSSAYALRPGTAPSSGLYVPTTTQGQYGLQGTTQGGQGAIQGSGSGSQGTSATSGQTQGAYGSLGTYGAQGSSYGSSQSSSGQSALYSSSTGGSNIPSYQPVTGTSLYQSSLRGNVQGSTTGSVSGSGLPSYQSTAAYQSTTGYQGATYSSSGYTVSQSGATGTGSQYPTQPGAGKESKK